MSNALPALAQRPSSSAPSPWRSHGTRVTAIRPEAPGVFTIDLVFREPCHAFGFAPGQFTMLHLPGIGEAAISIASDPAVPSPVSHTFRAVGNVTHALARLAVGDEVLVRGPFGRGWPLAAIRGRDVIVAAGGVGLASLRAAICHLARHRSDYGSVAILHGAKTPADLLYPQEYDWWRGVGLNVFTIVDAADSRWPGAHGVVPDLFADLDIDPGSTSLFCCGPEPMMHAVVARALQAFIASSDIFLALERNMSCAAGFCGLCQFGPAFVCKDGPVFRHDTIAAFLAVPHL
ncbi:MAG: FAD/NAD(P)-binding protein [Pirellulales bacterium]